MGIITGIVTYNGILWRPERAVGVEKRKGVECGGFKTMG